MKDNKEISLFLDTATKALAIGAIFGSEKDYIVLPDSKKALEMTNLGIEALGKRMGFTLSDVDSFYCLLGRGSNTGIRLGLTIPRTIYAFNPNIKIYGIETLKIFLASGKAFKACLSDRSGNLFFGEMKDGQYSYQKVVKTDISVLDHSDPIIVEEEDELASQELFGFSLEKISVIQTMMEYYTAFEDFSQKEEDYLPEYALKI